MLINLIHAVSRGIRSGVHKTVPRRQENDSYESIGEDSYRTDYPEAGQTIRRGCCYDPKPIAEESPQKVTAFPIPSRTLPRFPLLRLSAKSI